MRDPKVSCALREAPAVRAARGDAAEGGDQPRKPAVAPLAVTKQEEGL
jgi:hypothetical protein